MGDVDNIKEKHDQQAQQQGQSSAFTFAAVMGMGMGAGVFAAANVARAVLKENKKDLTAPIEVPLGVGKATGDLVINNPGEAAAAAAVGGIPGLVAQAMGRQIIKKNPGVVIAAGKVGSEAAATAVEAATSPFPGVVIAKKVAEVDMAIKKEAVKQVVQDVANLPNKAQQFQQERPVTSTIIDVGAAAATGSIGSATGIDKVVTTGVKGAAQTVSDKVDRTLKFLGIR